jgi:pimeloyl-ACP methyl ester carboxylesterase
MSLVCTIDGTGDPVLFLHGCPTSPDVLAPIAQAVAQTHRAIQIALPGYGASAPLAAPFTVADIHAAIEATVAPLLQGRKLTLVGFSGGGYHALALAARGQLATGRVICLAGLMSQTPAGRDGFRQFAAALRQGVDLHGVAPDRFLSPAFKATHPEAARAVTAWLDATPPVNLASELDAFAAAPDLDDAVAALDVPIFARVGALDVAVGSAESERIVAAAKAGTLEVVPGAGHALVFEDLDGTTASVLRSLMDR